MRGSSPAEPDLDVAVVGGGPVGLYTAILLLRRGLRVRVFEQRTGRSAHSRAIGIHPPGLRALAAAGVADRLSGEGMRIRRGQARFGGSLVAEVRFDSADPKYPFVLTLPQVRTEQVLEERLAALDASALVRGAAVTGVRQGPGSVTLDVAGPASDASVTARLLVAADGARSGVRGLLAVPRTGERVLDSYLMGDFADDTGDGPLGVLYLEPDGIVESFPLPGGTRRWVAHTGALRPLDDAADLVREIRRRTGVKIDPDSNTMLSAFTVRTGRVRRMVHGRVLFLGDAAHEVSPIGGQGMTLGWMDAAAAVPLIVRSLRGDDVGAALLRFQRRRRRDAVVADAQARLNMALGRPLPPAVMAARNRAMGALLRSGPAADAVARRFTMQ